MQPVKLSSSDVSLALRHSLCIMGSGRHAGMEYGCEWRGAQSPVGTWPRWAWTWEVSRDDWDLIYKPLKYFWFARQEIGSRHPLNVCVCVCACTHTCVSWPSAGGQLHMVSNLQHAHKHACDWGDSMLLRKFDLLTPCCGSWLLLLSLCALGMLSWEGWCVGCVLSLGFRRQERGVGRKCA